MAKMQPRCPLAVILMGPAGAGKTTVGKALATALQCRFCDADELHSRRAIEQMRQGQPLSDDDRWPWLGRVREVIADAVHRGECIVIACSALRARYRDFLARGFGDAIRFVYLDAPRELLASRLAGRVGHFASRELLDSQLATLEPPPDAFTLDASEPVPRLVDAICRYLNL